jgi:hypothetical protein
MCNRLRLGDGFDKVTVAPTVLSSDSAKEADKAARYFPKAVILADDGTVLLRSQSLQCYPRIPDLATCGYSQEDDLANLDVRRRAF